MPLGKPFPLELEVCMNKLRQKNIGLLMVLLSASLATTASAQKVPPAVNQDVPDADVNNDVFHNIPKDSALISIQADGVPLVSVLKEICRKAKWGLVLNTSNDKLNRKVTVLLPQKKPAGDVVKMVLSQKDLQATLKHGVLHIIETPIARTSPSPSANKKSSPVDTDSRDIVINGFDELKKIKSQFKEKFEKHREKHGDRDNGTVERVEIGQPVKIARNEAVHKAVSVGNSVTVEGSVEEEAVAVGGNVVVKKGATIGTDATAIGGDVRVESGAVVEGEAVAVGGKVIVEEGAVVKGDRVSVNIPLPAISSISGLLGMGVVFGILAAIFRSFVILAVALIIVWVAPSRVTIAKDYLVKKTGWSFLSGLLIMLATVPLVVLLTMTIVGIPLIPFLIFLLIAVVVFGLAALLLWLGYWMPIFKNKKSPVGAVVVGFFIFLLINMIPIIGGIFLLVASLAAAGATFLSRFGKQSRAL